MQKYKYTYGNQNLNYFFCLMNKRIQKCCKRQSTRWW